MKEVLVTIDGQTYAFEVPESTKISEIAKAVEGLGGRPKDRG